jgi:hypothetical protein
MTPSTGPGTVGNPGADSPHDGVELQIARVIVASSIQATVTVRCLRGPVRRDARFDRLRGSSQALDLKLTQFVVYGSYVAELDTGATAVATLRGQGVQHLDRGPGSGWQVVQGTNPAR